MPMSIDPDVFAVAAMGKIYFSSQLGTLKQMEAIAKRVTYKPGWTISITFGGSPNDFIVFVKRDGPDSNNPHYIVPLITTHSITYNAHRDDLQDSVLRGISKALQLSELHEIDEWLRLDGVRITNPHPENE